MSQPPPRPHPAQSIVSHWTKAPTFVPATTGGATDGRQLGNGDLGVAVSSANGSNALSFNLGINQFWSINSTEAPRSKARVRTVGGVTLTFPQQRPPVAFEAWQSVYGANVTVVLCGADAAYRLDAFIHSRSAMLVVTVTAVAAAPAADQQLAADSALDLNTFTYGPYAPRSGCVSRCESGRSTATTRRAARSARTHLPHHGGGSNARARRPSTCQRRSHHHHVRVIAAVLPLLIGHRRGQRCADKPRRGGRGAQQPLPGEGRRRGRPAAVHAGVGGLAHSRGRGHCRPGDPRTTGASSGTPPPSSTCPTARSCSATTTARSTGSRPPAV